MLRRVEAVLFDLDGVLVDSARLHARAWKRVFDAFFSNEGIEDEFDQDRDYRDYVDGRPRYEGVASFLASRDIRLPPGDPDDPPGFSTETAVGNLKNQMFHELVESHGIDVLPGARSLLEGLTSRGVPVGVVSSSRNARRILPADLFELVDVLLGGDDLAEMGVPGKPDPRMFVEGARRLGSKPSVTAVVEDAAAGVEAGRRGGFSLVVGIGEETSLKAADVVVSDVAQLPSDVRSWPGLIGLPPSAHDEFDTIHSLVDGYPAIFLDYDGTLTPIVEDPASATIGEEVRSVLRRLSERVPVAVVSGRALADVRSMVSVEGLTYSGSHGFEILFSDGSRFEHEGAGEAVSALDRATSDLESSLAGLDGVMVERKPYAIAIHTRRARDEAIRRRAGSVAQEVVSNHPELILRGGKEIHELRPGLEWDKGSALDYLVERLPEDPVPVYLGDDETDEDAFLAARRRCGLGILVGEVGSGADTWADYTLVDPEDTVRFLSRLSNLL